MINEGWATPAVTNADRTRVVWTSAADYPAKQNYPGTKGE
jgi:hypothetical protein